MRREPLWLSHASKSDSFSTLFSSLLPVRSIQQGVSAFTSTTFTTIPLLAAQLLGGKTRAKVPRLSSLGSCYNFLTCGLWLFSQGHSSLSNGLRATRLCFLPTAAISKSVSRGHCTNLRLKSQTGIPRRNLLQSTTSLLVACHLPASRFSRRSITTTMTTVFAHRNEDGGLESKRIADEKALEDARAYNQFASLAAELSNGHIGGNGSLLTVIRSVRDVDQNKRRRYLYHIPLLLRQNTKDGGSSATSDDGNELVPLFNIPPVEIHNDIAIRLPSPSGQKVAIFRQEVDNLAGGTSTNGDAGMVVLEIWDDGGQTLVRRISLDKTRHGKVMNDFGGFGQPVWNQAETALLYAAERPAPKTSSFFSETYESNRAKINTPDESEKQPPTRRGGQFTMGQGKTEHWGESYFKQSALLDLFVVSTETGRIVRVENCPGGNDTETTLGGYCLGQAVFAPDGQSILYSAWDAGSGSHMPRRLGLIHCQQRHCQLYQSSIVNLMKQLTSLASTEGEKDGSCINLTPDFRLARSPRFTPLGGKLVFLGSRKGFDTHGGCVALYSMDWTSESGCKPDTEQVIIDQVWDPRESAPDSGTIAGLNFPGLYVQELPTACFTSENALLLTTQWGSCCKTVCINILDKTVSLLDVGEGDQSSDQLVCISPGGGAIVSTSACNKPVSLWYISQTVKNIPGALNKHLLIRMPPVAASKFSSMPISVDMNFSLDIDLLTDLPKMEGVDIEIPVQSILLLPPENKEGQLPPLIVIPHGGPHGVSSTNYMPSYAFLCEHGGYAILLVNYRGSIGFGQGLIEALPRRCSTMDVKDVIAATLRVKSSGLVNGDKIGICGGSHGGFLTGHCTGQYPDLFQAAAMRNPVVNIATMVTTTDIPDWCYVETCGAYDWKQYRPPTAEELNVMWDMSPVKYMDQVKTPTIVALGLSDLRVPPSQGLEWYHSLRSKQVPTELLVYDADNHAISNPTSEADHWVRVKQWFDQFLRCS